MGKLSGNSRCLLEEFYVIEGLQTPWLGRMASSKLNLIQKVETVSTNANKADEKYTTNIIKSYPSLFKSLGELEGEYRIQLIHEPTPFALTLPRKVTLPFPGKTKAEVDRMLEIGVIFQSANQLNGVHLWLLFRNRAVMYAYTLI